jgi:hypothetical protein
VRTPARVLRAPVRAVFKSRQSWLAAAVALMAAGGLLAGSAAASAAGGSAAVVTISGAMPHTTAASTVVIEAEIGSHFDVHGVAKKLTDIYLASVKVPRGSAQFSVGVPASSALTKAERNGYVNVIIAVVSGGRETQQQLSVPLSDAAAAGNVPALAEVTSRQVQLPATSRFPAFAKGHLTAADLKPNVVVCGYAPYDSEFEKETVIGQVHVAKQAGMTEEFSYGTEADSSISVGISVDVSSNFTSSGTITLSNSISTKAGFTASEGTVQHVLSQIYYQEYKDNGAPACEPDAVYKVEPAGATGSAFLSTATPPAENPYGTCTSDPYGYVTVQAKTGTWGSDFGQAETEGAATTIYGMNFAATSGYSKDLYDNYTNGTPGSQFLCGTNNMPDVRVIFNNER